MTVTTTPNFISYDGDGSTVAFDFPYYFFTHTDLIVMETDTTTGAEYPQQEGVRWTLSGTVTDGVYRNGGTITMGVATPTGRTLTIWRDVAELQDVSLPSNEALPPKTLEKGYDKLTLITQRLSSRLDKALTLPETFIGNLNPTLPQILNPLDVIRVNAAGTRFDTVSPSDATFAASLANLLAGGQNYRVLKYDSNADNNLRWGQEPVVDVSDYGAVGDGVTDDTAAVQAAIDDAAHSVLFFPHQANGSYLISSTLNVVNSMCFRGECGGNSSGLVWTGAGAKMLVVADTCDNFLMENFELDNVGTATHGLYLSCSHATIRKVKSNPTVKFSTAIISTSTTATTYNMLFSNCFLAAKSLTEMSPIGIYCARGTNHVIDNCMFSNLDRGVVGGGGGGQAVGGFSVINSRFETGDGVTVGLPGSANSVCIDAVSVEGLTIIGNSLEGGGGSGDTTYTTTQLAVKITDVLGGIISGNHITGDGVLNSLIKFVGGNTKGVKIEGNELARFGNQFAIAFDTAGVQWQNEIGTNYLQDSTKHAFDNTFTPAITFGGASVGLTYTSHGRAQRAGKFLHVRGIITLTAKGSSVGTAIISGLPVNADAGAVAGDIGNFDTPPALAFFNLQSIVGSLQGFVSNGAKTLRMFQMTTGAQVELTNSNFTDTSAVIFQATYETAQSFSS